MPHQTHPWNPFTKECVMKTNAIVALCATLTTPVLAQQKIEDHAAHEANKHLMQANLPSLSPMQCTQQISKAKKALREGKQ